MQARDENRHSGQAGISLVQAIFILVVFSALGTFMVSQFMVQSRTASLTQQGVRAYAAAQSGIEWGLHRAVNASTCNPGQAFDVQGFQVSVNCTSSTYQEGAQNHTLYSIRSKAEYGSYPSPDYVSREISVQVIE